MDQRVWSTCLYCLMRANYDLADCMKIRYKNLRFNSSKSSSADDRHTRGPASGFFNRTRGKRGIDKFQLTNAL